MISLENAAKIHSELQNIFENGESKFLSESNIHSNHEICQYMDILNSQYKSYHMSNLSGQDFIQSLKVDGEEVVGYKKVEVYRNNYNYYYNSLRNKSYTEDRFYVDIEKICELANPAPFGKGSETVYDEEVRKALEIKADRIKIIKKENNTKNFFDEQFKEMIPAGKKFVYKLYKMQIYQEGGKFESHKDTIHTPNHYATLVVSIPTTFTGGELVSCSRVAPPHDAVEKVEKEVEKDEKDERDEVEIEVETEDEVDEDEVKNKYLFKCNFSNYYEKSIIFLTDVDHEVKPVTSGTRIVLQYDVYIEEKEEENKKSENEEGGEKSEIEGEKDEENDYENDYDEDNSECPYNKPLKEFLCNQNYIEELNINVDQKILSSLKKFLEEKSITEVCFLLSHKYPLSISKEYLKNGDLKLYQTLIQKYDVELGYVVNHYMSDYDDSYDETRMDLKVMSYTDLQNFLEYCKTKKETNLESKVETKKPPIHIFVTSADFNCTVSKYYVEHTGNEAAPAEYSYVSIALCVKIRE